MTQITSQFLTVTQVAEFLNRSKAFVAKKCASGELPAYKIGENWSINKSELQQWIDSKKNDKQQ